MPYWPEQTDSYLEPQGRSTKSQNTSPEEVKTCMRSAATPLIQSISLKYKGLSDQLIGMSTGVPGTGIQEFPCLYHCQRVSLPRPFGCMVQLWLLLLQKPVGEKLIVAFLRILVEPLSSVASYCNSVPQSEQSNTPISPITGMYIEHIVFAGAEKWGIVLLSNSRLRCTKKRRWVVIIPVVLSHLG